ncbi:MAG: hypothetical protein ABW224_23625 [Kibdelosporangium sp.]
MTEHRSGLHAARNVLTAAWVGVSSLQFVIWVLICVIGWHFANPFWLWTVVVGGLVVGAMWLAPGKTGTARR